MSSSEGKRSCFSSWATLTTGFVDHLQGEVNVNSASTPWYTTEDLNSPISVAQASNARVETVVSVSWESTPIARLNGF